MAGKKRAPYGSRQIAKLVRRQGADKVAANLGVSPSTVKRYSRNGVPEKHRDRVRSAVARSDRSVKSAKHWAIVRRDVRVMEKHGAGLTTPVTQVFYDRETGWILGTSYDKEGKPETRRAIIRRWYDEKVRRWRTHAWWAYGTNIEGYTPESFFAKYESAFGSIPKAQIWIDWREGPVIVHNVPRGIAA